LFVGEFAREITKPQPRLKGDRLSLLQPIWDYDATSARSALEVKPASNDRTAIEPAFQISCEISGRLVARFWITFETARTNRLQIAIERWCQRA
jgi:hypothetical protein